MTDVEFDARITALEESDDGTQNGREKYLNIYTL